jgi:hypothetical protein
VLAVHVDPFQSQVSDSPASEVSKPPNITTPPVGTSEAQ